MQYLEMSTWSTIDVWSSEARFTPASVAHLGWFKAGIARIEWLPEGVRISVGPYVGRIVIPGVLTITVNELVPGTVSALLNLTAGAAKIEKQAEGRGRTRVPPWVPLVARFASLLSEYTRGGIDRRYLYREIDSPYARGRVQVRETLRRHRARGRTDRLSCAVRELGDDGSLNRALLLAGSKAERLLRGTPYGTELRMLRRALRSFGGVSMDPSVNLLKARDEATAAVRPIRSDLIDLADVLIREITAETEDHGDRQPVSAWINLEAVFEQAVRRIVARALSPGAVRFGGTDEVPLLRGGEELGAEPDVVVDLGERRLLLDPKYRRHGSAVGRGEIYQLMSHADAYEADGAALITPRLSETDTDRFLGRDSRGCPYHVIVVEAADADAMRRRLEELLEVDENFKLPTEPKAPLGTA